MKTRTITIGFSTSKVWNPFSALIRWWWGVPYSHVYLRWSTPWGFDEILEASGMAVRMKEATTWNKKQKIVEEFEFTITKQEFDAVMREIRSQTGKPYGWSQIIGICIAELLRLKRNPIPNGKRALICSEVGLWFMKIMGFCIKHLNEDLVNPKDIYDLLVKER